MNKLKGKCSKCKNYALWFDDSGKCPECTGVNL